MVHSDYTCHLMHRIARCFPAAAVIMIAGLMPASPAFAADTEPPAQGAAESWKPLFDGKSLQGWQVTNYGGEGEVEVRDSQIHLEDGVTLTGLTYQGDVPKSNYEVRLEAMRVDGIDFFCGLTFPVKESHCSFIVGGWAGAVVGLSSIDGRDASENETTRYMTFKKSQWYKIRVRVTDKKIEAWIDDQQVVDQDLEGKRIATRNEVNPSRPFGICAWQTKAALRNIELRKLD